MVIEKKLIELRKFIQRHALFGSDERLLLAISGGVDSVLMGRLLWEMRQPFDVVHCNFKLRADASDGDEAFVKELATQWNARFHSTSFDTSGYAEENGLSIQMAARALRYAYFDELQIQNGYDKVATAHHVNDALETMLINLSHGTGYRGMFGITPMRGHFVRPMLAFTNAEIREMASELNVSWREDASNEKDDYERNKIRHHLVPLMEELNPAIGNTLKDTLERIWTSRAVLTNSLHRWENEHIVETEGHIEVTLDEADTEVAFFLFEALKTRTSLSYKSFKQLEDSIRLGVSGKLFLTDTHRINLDRGKLIVTTLDGVEPGKPVLIDESDEQVSFQSGLLICEWTNMPVSIERSAAVAMIDASKLNFPLELRVWKEGDAFVPLGMKGQKKISDFMIDAKIPVNLKSRVFVLLSKGQVVWVVGKRLDDRFKITNATERIYKLKVC